MIYTSFTPTKWRDAKVIFIPKPGKTTYQKAKDFRPISLTNHLLKGLEKLVVKNVDQVLETMSISEQQQGNKRNDHCLAVFLNIAAAFDTINPNHIRQSLLDKEVDSKLVNWYFKYITERHLSLESDDYEIKTCVDASPKAAKFWIIAFDPAI